MGESTHKPGTPKSKGTADTSQNRSRSAMRLINCAALCESRYHTYNDYRHKDLSVIKSEKSVKGVGLLEKIINTTGEPLKRKKVIL